jgi:hypothetical protein
LEHLQWDGDLGHLERDVAAVADDLRTDLDRLPFRLGRDQSLIGSGVAAVSLGLAASALCWFTADTTPYS